MTLISIIGLIAWSLLLTLALLTLRSALVLSGKAAINTFTADGSGSSDASVRLVRTLANSLENLPILIGVLLLAITMQAQTITDSVAIYILLARMAQSTCHLLSTSPAFVAARFSFYLVQLLLVAYILLQLFLTL
jgi:hypothetical protein